MDYRRPRPARRRLTLFVALAILLASVASASADRRAGAPEATSSRACTGHVFYEVSRIEVRKARGVGCRRAKRLARGAVAYRVTSGFPEEFCRAGYCWRFGEPKGVVRGLSRIKFVGRDGNRRIRAVQFVT